MTTSNTSDTNTSDTNSTGINSTGINSSKPNSDLDVSTGVVVFSSDFCPFCVRAKQLLKHKQVNFKEVRVDGAPQLRAQMAERAGRSTVPQIWVQGTHVGGCDDLFALEQNGELDRLLNQI